MKHNIIPNAQGTIRAWARIDYPNLSNMIAEVVDNSLDARKPSQSNLKVEVIVEKNDPASTHIDTVVVTDNGTGVKNLPGLFRFGSSTKNMVNTIGGFGAGLKQAGAAMTNGHGALEVITRRDGEEWYGRFEYSTDQWRCDVFQITDVTAQKAQVELFKKYLPKTHKTGTAVIISGVDTRGETNTKSGGYYYRQLQADLLLTYNHYLYKNAGVTIRCGEYELSKKKTMTDASSSCDYDLLHLDPLKTNFLCGGPDFNFQLVPISLADGTKKKLWVRASHTPGQRTDQASCPFKKASSYGTTSGAYQNTVSFLTKTGRRIHVDHRLAKKVFRNLNYLSQFHIEIMFQDPIDSTDSIIVTDASKTGVKVVSAAKTALKNLLQHHIDRLAERQKSSKATTTKSEQKSLDAACSSAGLSYEDRFSPTQKKVEVVKQKRRRGSGTGTGSVSGSGSGSGNGGSAQTTDVHIPRTQSQTGAVTPSSSWSASFSKFKRRDKNRQFKVTQPADGKYDIEMNTLHPSYVAAKNLPDWNNGGCDNYILDTLAVAMTELDYNIHYESSTDYFDFTECLDGYKKLLHKNTERVLEEEEEQHIQAAA